MKRVIVSTISGHSNILDEILYDLTADYFEEFPSNMFDFAINDEHRCIDVFKNDKMYAQIYPKPFFRGKQNKYKYEYVGEGNGSYNRVKEGKQSRKLYDSEDVYVKYIDLVSDDSYRVP